MTPELENQIKDLINRHSKDLKTLNDFCVKLKNKIIQLEEKISRLEKSQ
jgi:phage shock protein A